MSDFSKVPAGASLKPKPFTLHVEDQKLSDMKQLIKLSPLGPKTYENQQSTADRRFGMNYQWMEKAKESWLSEFDWRKCEDHINSFPNFTVQIPDAKGQEHTIHFAALFSSSTSATTPLLFMHGWPGSFLEFLPMLDVLRKRYTPESLPFNVIVPSLPGYGLSGGPTLDRQWSAQEGAMMMDKLMVGLGLTGYVTQGGDIGSFFSRILATESDSCKAMHVNFSPVGKPKDESASASMTAAEQKGLERAHSFNNYGSAYAREHGSRPGTIGVVLSSSPIALLAWIAEKFLEWSDADPSMHAILESVSLYWLTDSFARSIYPYAEFHGQPAQPGTNDNEQLKNPHDDERYYCKKPMGYSWFPLELMPIPVGWVKTTGNLVWHKSHEKGGHFAALELPEVLLDDVEDFVKTIGTFETAFPPTPQSGKL